MTESVESGVNKLFEGRSGYWLGRVLKVWSMVSAVLILAAMLAVPIAASDQIKKGEAALSGASERVGELTQIARNARDGVAKAYVALDASASALEAAQTNLEGMGPLLESIQQLLGEEAPDALIATQSGLASAESGARAMDQMLRVLSSLRFLTGVTYAPEQPLDESLSGISESLIPLPEALISLSEEIEIFAQTLELVGPEVGESVKGIESMSASLRTTSASISGTIEGLEALELLLQKQAQAFERNVWIAVAVVELVLFQMLLLQLIGAYISRQLELFSDRPEIDWER